MTSTPSQTLSPLAETILGAMKSGGLVAPEAFLGKPLGEGFAVQAEIFAALDVPLKGSKHTLKGDLCHSAPLLDVSETAHQRYQTGISVEVELAFTLGKDVTAAKGTVTRADIVDAIASVRIGVELLRSRYEGGARGDQALAVADMMSNVGYVLGPELDRKLLDQGTEIGPLKLVINGETVFDKSATHPDNDPLKPIVALANQTAICAFDMLKAGQVITTGTLCGLIKVGAPGAVEVTLGGRDFVLKVD